jgi:hypothetical protein
MSRYLKRISSTLTSPEDREIHAKIRTAHKSLLAVLDICRSLEKKAAFGLERTRIKRTIRDTDRALGALDSIRVLGSHTNTEDPDLMIEPPVVEKTPVVSLERPVTGDN